MAISNRALNAKKLGNAQLSGLIQTILAHSTPRRPLKLNLTDGVLIPQANRKPRRGAELVGVAKRPASAIGGHHDHRAENYPCQGWTAGACQAARQCEPSLQDDGLQPRQFLPLQGTLRQRRRAGTSGDQPQEAGAEEPCAAG